MFIGNAGPYLSACIRYESLNLASSVALIVGLVVGLSLGVSLILILVAVVCTYKRRCRKQKTADDNYDNKEVEMWSVDADRRATDVRCRVER